jgi:hypothetical protein
VENAPTLSVMVSVAVFQWHRLVEHELAFVVGSPENRVKPLWHWYLCGVAPVQRRCTYRNKEGTTRIHPYVFSVSIAVISILYYCTFTYCIACHLGKFTQFHI